MFGNLDCLKKMSNLHSCRIIANHELQQVNKYPNPTITYLLIQNPISVPIHLPLTYLLIQNSSIIPIQLPISYLLIQNPISIPIQLPVTICLSRTLSLFLSNHLFPILDIYHYPYPTSCFRSGSLSNQLFPDLEPYPTSCFLSGSLSNQLFPDLDPYPTSCFLIWIPIQLSVS